MGEQEQIIILDLSEEILNIAATKIHNHDNATNTKSGYMSASDKNKLDNIEENANNSEIIIDDTLEDDTISTNPVQAKVIAEKIREIKEDVVSISDEIIPTSTNKGVSGKAVSDYVSEKILESETGTMKEPYDAGAFSSFDSITDNGVYYIEQNPTNIVCGQDIINVHGGYMTVQNAENIQRQNIIASDGTEYSRWKNNSNNWSSWTIYYMPHKQYTKEFIVNTDVYNFEVTENTNGYNIKWNQSLSNDKNYFITSSKAGEWKHVALFQPSLQIDGAYVFASLQGNMDIMITSGHYDGFYNKNFDSGVYIRSPNGSAKIKGINQTFFVPRNN